MSVIMSRGWMGAEGNVCGEVRCFYSVGQWGCDQSRLQGAGPG